MWILGYTPSVAPERATADFYSGASKSFLFCSGCSNSRSAWQEAAARRHHGGFTGGSDGGAPRPPKLAHVSAGVFAAAGGRGGAPPPTKTPPEVSRGALLPRGALAGGPGAPLPPGGPGG